MTQFQAQEWRSQLAIAERANWKEHIYRVMRPIWNKSAQRELNGTLIKKFSPAMVLGERGFPLIARRQWAVNGSNLLGKTILVMGTGTGWDVASWAKFLPSRIVGVDLYEFSSWSEVKQYCASRYGVPVEMRAQSLTDMHFLEDGSFDLIVSDAVLEHVTDLAGLLREAYRLLKPNGQFYAGYGPLWYSAGGDHFSGRGGLSNAYNHLLLSSEKYAKYLKVNSNEIEDFQSGLRYVELGLFSKLKTAEYLSSFSNAGFVIDSLIFEISKEALLFRKNCPALMEQLILKYPLCDLDCFMVKANFVRLRKADPSPFPD
jgi:2-polyprenyl-3-methyl-5-hydroxy-6-metoxy-1,4-benzoquinol methylase